MKKKWWHDKTAYQIYPKSFLDTDGDGVGDLNGIRKKLDYLKELGIGIVWISPVYQSPFADQGYDVSDYYAIDPVFGTMQDMDKLIAEAKKHNIAVIMDLVVNHCSEQHEWFQKALADPFGPYGNYFYIREGKEGKAPCNWRSYFGGSAWEKLPGYDNLFYLHMFAKEQPDLNWENPVLRQEIYKMARWWLDKGIAGFRLDAINKIKKDLRFQDFPADREDGMCAPSVMLRHTKGVHEFLQEMKREVFAPYNAFTIGELSDLRPEEIERYIGEDGCFESIFDFAPNMIGRSPNGWYDGSCVTPEDFRNAVYQSKRASQDIGMMANIIENHDEPRGGSRYLPEGERMDAGKKMLAGISVLSFGLPFLYQGQEIGMTNKRFKNIDEVNDISTLGEYRLARKHGYDEERALKLISDMSRDNARTPMQWNDSPHAGFTEGIPWLMENENYLEINVAIQEGRRDSVLSFYKRMIALRTDEKYGEAVVYGKQQPLLMEQRNLICFLRKGMDKTLLIIANYQKEEREIFLPGGYTIKKVLLSNYEERQFPEKEKVVYMAGYQLFVLEV